MAESKRFGFTALVGEPNVGKSSILNAMINKKLSIVSHKVQTTRFRLNGIMQVEKSQLVFIDTPGICETRSLRDRKYNKVAWRSIHEANIVALVLDAKNGITEGTNTIIKRLRSNFPKAVNTIAVVNKIDLADKLNILLLSEKISKDFGIEDIFYVSAKKRLGFDALKGWLASNVPHGDWLFEKDQLSDAPLNFIVSEITREKIFLRLHDELPYDIEVKTREWKNQKDDSCMIFQDIFVERASQKGIVLGKNGEAIKSISINAREDMSKFLSKKVHLFLRVKLKKAMSREQ